MKSRRHEPLITFVQWFLTIALWAEIALAIAVLFTITMTAFQEGKLLSAWPITVGAPAPAFQLTTNRPHLTDLTIRLEQGTLTFAASGTAYYMLKLVDSLFLFLVAGWITVLLQKICRTLSQKTLFTQPNARRIRTIALLVLTLTPYSLLKSVIYRSYIQHWVVVAGKQYASLSSYLSTPLSSRQIWLDFQVDMEAFLLGMVIFLMAELFRIGVLLRAENESFV